MLSDKDSCINYVEFDVLDIERAKAFYGAAFGWTFTDFGPDYCEFNDSQMKGGFARAETVNLGGPLIVLFGDDLELLQDKVVEAGGTISQEIFEFPGGKRFHFKDPEGYELAIWCHI
ncbi:MAG: VOC family protein [Alphaproteobacteria bacterium]|nr:VOC family protein [Alphaproteobacteria bacterium]